MSSKRTDERGLPQRRVGVQAIGQIAVDLRPVQRPALQLVAAAPGGGDAG